MMRSLILFFLLIASSAFCDYPGGGATDPATGKNYYVNWLPCLLDPYAPPGQGMSSDCGGPLVFSLNIMTISGQCAGNIADVMGEVYRPQNQCWYTSGKLSDAGDCSAPTVFYTNGGCYEPCDLNATKKGVIDPSTHSCVPAPALPALPSFSPNLHTYDGDPYACWKHGGFPNFTFVPHGGNFNGYLYTGKDGSPASGIAISCNSKADTALSAAAVILLAKAGMGGTGNNDGLLARGLAKAKALWVDMISGKTPPVDITIGMPKYNPSTGYTDVEIISRDIPKGADGVTPSASPKADIDPYTAFLRDEYFPKNGLDANGKPLNGGDTSSLADINRFNTDNRAFKDNGVDPIDYTSKGNIYDQTAGSSSTVPVQDSPLMYSSYQPKPSTAIGTNDTTTAPNWQVSSSSPTTFYPPVPKELSPVPVVRTSADGMDGTYPTKIWTNDITYQDGSSLRQVYTLNTVTNRGTEVSTTIDRSGNSSTVGLRFEMPNYKPNSTNPADYEVIKDSPVSTGVPTIGKDVSPITPSAPIDPVTNYPKQSGSSGGTSTNPLIQKDALNETTMVPFDSTPLPETSFIGDITGAQGRMEGLIKSIGDMGTNINGSYDALNKIFVDDIALLKGKGFTPIDPPSDGQCGDMLTIHFHGTDTDLCPPMVTTVNKVSPMFETLTVIGGMTISISIFLGGF